MAKKIKVGILTTYFASNYGAMLQCYALKTALTQLNCNVEVIRYKQKSVYDYYNPYSLRKFIGPKLRFHPRYVINYLPVLAKRKHRFNKFLYKYINSHKGFSKNIPKDKDLYIIGSDQLWKRFLDGNFDPVYMGFFETNPNAIKITYAVSGENIKIDATSTCYIEKAFMNFKMVSMREANIASRYLDNIKGSQIDVVVDPTMLIGMDVYRKIPHINPLPSDKFVLFYSIRQKNNEFLKKIHSFALSQGLKLLVLSEGFEIGVKEYAKENKNIIYMPTAGIDVFLGAIDNAEYVFTPSFHGTVFSLLYHKKFFNMLLDDGNDSRGINLLSQLNLSQLHLRINDEIKPRNINYTEVDFLIAKNKEISFDFLNKAITLASHE